MAPLVKHISWCPTQQISTWDCTDCAWQLCSHSCDRWRAIYFWTFWYYRARGLRQMTTAELSTNRCVSSLFFSGFWNWERRVGTWDNSPLSKHSFLAVGTQIDLRDDPSSVEKLAKDKQKPITPETAENLPRDPRAITYVECSALHRKSTECI